MWGPGEDQDEPDGHDGDGDGDGDEALTIPDACAACNDPNQCICVVLVKLQPVRFDQG